MAKQSYQTRPKLETWEDPKMAHEQNAVCEIAQELAYYFVQPFAIRSSYRLHAYQTGAKTARQADNVKSFR